MKDEKQRRGPMLDVSSFRSRRAVAPGLPEFLGGGGVSGATIPEWTGMTLVDGTRVPYVRFTILLVKTRDIGIDAIRGSFGWICACWPCWPCVKHR